MSSTVADGATRQRRRRPLPFPNARLFWRRFRRHKLAMAGLVVTLLLYLIALFAEPIAPFNPDPRQRAAGLPPAAGDPLVRRRRVPSLCLAFRLARDPATLAATYVPDPNREVYLGVWVKGDPYNLWGLFPADPSSVRPA